MKNNDIRKAIEDSIKTDELSSLTHEIGEIVLDSIFEEGALKDIPVFSTITAFVKTGINIREKIFVKKILKFLFELRDVSIKDRTEFLYKIDNDPQFESKVGESIMMIIEKSDSLQKTKLLGKLFSTCILEQITYNQFLKLSSIINRAYVPTLFKLVELENGSDVGDEIYEELFNLNLVTLKIVDDTSHTGISGAGFRIRTGLPVRGEKPELFNQKIEYRIS